MEFQPHSQQANFHTFLATDGIELQGVLMAPDPTSSTVIIHVHGLAGNFYENPFIFAEAEAVRKHGYSIFSFNNRGHDYLADLVQWTNNTNNGVQGGGAFEIFENCVHDINGAIAVLKEAGYKRIILQGHSTGCNKVIYYCKTCAPELTLAGVILLSPCDDVGMVKNSLDDQYNQKLTEAKAMINRSEGDSLMPNNPFFGYPMSANTFVEMAREGGSHDIFQYRFGNSMNSLGPVCDVPLLTLFGGEEDYLDVPDSVAKSYLKHFTTGPMTFCKIKDAPHSYRGSEHFLVTHIVNWLDSEKWDAS